MARWIKISVDTPNKPAIRNAARDCGCSQGDAFIAFFRLYSWLDEQTADGMLYTDRQEVDAVARLPGFAASLERSGWLAFSGDTCQVINWNQHNGQSAKRRAQEAKRMNELREERRRQGMPVRPCPQMPQR
jgi:hypothetical protein